MESAVRKTSDRFLAVACGRRYLSYAQAGEIDRLQQKFSWLRDRHRPVGELAVELGYLPSPQLTALLSLQEDDRRKGTTYPDPLLQSSRRVCPPRLTLPLRLLLAALILVPILVSAYLTAWNWAHIATVATICAAITSCLMLIVPRYDERNLQFTTPIAFFMVALLLGSLAYSFSVGVELYEATATDHRPAAARLHVLFQHFVISFVSTGFCLLWFGWLALWRRSELRANDVRTGMLRSTVSRALDAAALSPSGERGNDGTFAVLDELLRGAVDLLSTNVWGKLVARLAFWNNAAGSISIWYLEPTRDATGVFRIIRYATSKPPSEEVVEAYRELAARYRPVGLDESTFERVYGECKQEAIGERKKDWKRRFVERGNRPSFVSLTGWVFAKRIDLISGNAGSCLAFDRKYARVLPQKYQNERVSRWLNFQSFAAFPIFDGVSRSTTPVGVLIAFRNIRNGFTSEDVDGMITLSRIYGLVRSAQYVHTRGKESARNEETQPSKKEAAHRLSPVPGGGEGIGDAAGSDASDHR